MAKAKKNNEIEVKIENENSTENIVIDLQNTSKNIKIDDSVLVKVKSSFYGKLIFRNRRSGEVTKWDSAGDIQIMSMGDLRVMKAEYTQFFRNQWIVIIGVADGSECEASCADIYKALVITKYYENYVEPTDFETILSWNDAEIVERVSLMSEGARRNLVVALNEFIETGIMDSMRKIKLFEKVLGCQLLIH